MKQNCYNNTNIIFCHYNIMTKSKKKTGKKWSIKYKKSINCNRPKGFSQKQYCKFGRRNHTKKNR
jgi:hypothetical protein